MPTTPARVAVVGAGVSGLTAAYDLRRLLGDDATIDVFTADDAPGGILDTRPVGGGLLDVGAEAFIVRRPEALDLVTELGLAGRVVSPGTLRPAIWSDGALHPLPSPAVMGIPGGSETVRGLVDQDAVDRIDSEPDRPLNWTPGTDVAVGDLVADRFGDQVVSRCVDPMLGGVYSSLARDLGLRETVPALAAALDAGAPSLTAAVAAVLGRPTGTGPVFGALDGGYRLLVDALVAAARADIRSATEITSIARDGRRYVLDGNGAYDGVVVAVPVWTAGRLLADVAAEPAATLSAVQGAGPVVVALAVAGHVPQYSGVLVATDADLSIKAITMSSGKWPHLAREHVSLLRTSFGRLGQPVAGTDAELVKRAVADVRTVFDAAGLDAPNLVDALVRRWPGGLPHYRPGHLTAMSEAVERLPAGIAVAGSGYQGVGVPACIGTARAAAARIAEHVTLTT